MKWLIFFLLQIILCIDIDEPVNLGMGISLPSLEQRDKSEGLQEFTPIKSTIGQSETQFFSFNVNTSSGVGEYYEFLIFLTGNICSQPSNVNANDTSLAVYYSFNSSMFQNFELGQMQLFHNGYFQALADVPITLTDNQNSILYIAVRAPQNIDITSTWMYEIGVSQNDLVFQWDDRSWATLVDTDEDSALIVTGNLTSDGDYEDFNISNSRFSLYIYSEEYRHYFDSLNSSWCAIRNGPALLDPSKLETSFTTRSGGLQQQFHVTGLNSSTRYIAYLVSDFAGKDFGGAVYQPFEFETMDKDACDLIYDLEFCNKVAYAVPNNPDLTKEELRSMYDDRAQALFQNFSKALQQIPCNASQDSVFSPIRTCDDCALSYKNWLCAVTIPRCSTRNITGYVSRDVGNNRNLWIDEHVQPYREYYEVLPCFNVCEAIVRDCPADFNFVCPKHNDSIKLSYYWDDYGEFPTCNFVGNSFDVTSLGIKLVVNGLLMLVMLVYVL